ncbi:hypothetical protein CDAR_248951 [Caerostris darwini]|uniref:C2H2-type domain-containing protein n=1 Tax=Caerostris darwini TaxID=1538125 RepID=A0AAV4RAQ2_9ARAC|nr:hypothetical protein CDAR_248951 [Caerostris darwini]
MRCSLKEDVDSHNQMDKMNEQSDKYDKSFSNKSDFENCIKDINDQTDQISTEDSIEVINNVKKEKSFKCDICNRLLKTKETLRMHQRIHLKDKSFANNECNGSNLDATNKSLQCDKCGVIKVKLLYIPQGTQGCHQYSSSKKL